MAEHSSIEWTDATWNPITGCSVVSPGCTNCYAMRLAGTRLKHHPSRAGLTRPSKAGPVWTGEVRLNEEWLTLPLKWRKPQMIFVCAHGDLFHEDVPDAWIDRVFAVMALTPQHTFQVLTKRAERMRDYFNPGREKLHTRWLWAGRNTLGCYAGGAIPDAWPLPNVWLGVSAEDQQRADQRVPHLLAAPASVRFVSAEPLLGPIDFRNLVIPRRYGSGLLDAFTLDFKTHHQEVIAGPPSGHGPLDQIIVGGENGPRPMLLAWVRSIQEQCEAAGVAFFLKQWGTWIDADQLLDGIERDPSTTLFVEGKPWQPPRPLNFKDAALLASFFNRPWLHHSDGSSSIRIGKGAAGRLLDGVEHNGMPRVAR